MKEFFSLQIYKSLFQVSWIVKKNTDIWGTIDNKMLFFIKAAQLLYEFLTTIPMQPIRNFFPYSTSMNIREKWILFMIKQIFFFLTISQLKYPLRRIND